MIRYLLLLGTLLGPCMGEAYVSVNCTEGDDDIYQFNATLLDESATINFGDYRGKVLAIYNVATYWGMSNNTYHQINALASTFAGEDFLMLGFPCNNFNLQEPGTSYDQILNGVKYVRPGGGFVANLTYFEKIDVNGDNEHPIYTYLKGHCSYTDTVFESVDMLTYSPLRINDVRWNWEKFLITKEGKPYKRFNAHTEDPAYLEDDIAYLLSQ